MKPSVSNFFSFFIFFYNFSITDIMFFFPLIIRKFSKRKIQIFFYFDYLSLIRAIKVVPREKKSSIFLRQSLSKVYQEQLVLKIVIDRCPTWLSRVALSWFVERKVWKRPRITVQVSTTLARRKGRSIDTKVIHRSIHIRKSKTRCGKKRAGRSF